MGDLRRGAKKRQRPDYEAMVLNALAELAKRKGEEVEGWHRSYRRDGWWTSSMVYRQIHGMDIDRSYYHGRQRSPSPSRDRVITVINQLRREGKVEYNPDSLGQESQWRLAG